MAADISHTTISVPDHRGATTIQALTDLHGILRPAAYLEIGNPNGSTLALASCASIAISPYFSIEGDVIGSKPACHFFQMGGGKFFSAHDPVRILGQPLDFCSLSGPYPFERLLRMFMHVERSCHRRSVVVLHGCLPTDIHVGRRDPRDRTRAMLSAHDDWFVGDLWKILPILKKYRPDLEISCFDARPAGLVRITGLDPGSTRLQSGFAAISREFLQLDLMDYGISRLFSEARIQPTAALLAQPDDPAFGFPGFPAAEPPGAGAALYLDLLIKCITNTIYGDANKGPWQPAEYDVQARRLGTDWPAVAHSMVGTVRMENLRDLTLAVLRDKVPGDLIETGVWRGGASILLRGILKASGETNRKVYVADSFQGLPPPNADAYPADAGDEHHTIDFLRVSKDAVAANFRAYDLLDEQVVFVEGWFKDTLPTLPARQFAIIRLDGDLYESTIQALESLYPKLSIGGFVIVDDYGAFLNCKLAVRDYRAAHGIDDQLWWVEDRIAGAPPTTAFWRRTK